MSRVAHPSLSTDGRPARAPALTDSVVCAVWWEFADLRRRLHRMHRVDRCDTALILNGVRLPGTGVDRTAQPGGTTWPSLQLSGSCPCRDYLADLLVEVAGYLAGRADLRAPAAAARAHLRLRGIGECIRRRRAEQGAQVRTDRIRTGAVGRALPDELHRAVLEYLVDEAGVPAPLEDEQNLVERLCERVAAEFGGTADAHRVAVGRTLPVIEATCRRVARHSRVGGELVDWWDRYISRPLGRRPRRHDAVAGAQPGEPALELACPWGERDVDEMLDSVAYGSCSRDDAVLAAVLAQPPRKVADVVLDLAAREVLPLDTARRFVTDPARTQRAQALVGQLAGAGLRS